MCGAIELDPGARNRVSIADLLGTTTTLFIPDGLIQATRDRV
jgi:hypothetical protein